MIQHHHKANISVDIPQRITGYLLVAIDNSDPDKAYAIIDNGINLFYGGFGSNARIMKLSGYLIAILLPDTIQKLDCVSFSENEGDFAFIEGTFYDFELLRKHKIQDDLIDPGLARELTTLAKTGDIGAFKQLNGRYSGFVYLSGTDSLYILTDAYGANKVFVYNKNNLFAVSNNVIALAANKALQVSVDETTVSQILQLEYPVYRNTEFSEVSIVLPSDILIRNGSGIRYGKFYQQVNRERKMSDAAYISGLSDTINSFFSNLHNYLNEPLGIFLSKGKDSRLFLPFLEKNKIPYMPFVFTDGSGVFDYSDVVKIAGLLKKDLHVLDHYTLDPRMRYLFGQGTTPTSSWLALSSVATQYTGYALMGLYGDISSGKMLSFRQPGINNMEDLMTGFFNMISKEVTMEVFSKTLPYFNKFQNWNTYSNLFRDYPKTDLLFDCEVYHDIDHRSFRNAVPILLKSHHYITPVTPFTEQSIASAYHSLPASLLKSQKAHTVIAATDSISNKIRSTAFPVSLKNERYLRPFMHTVIRLNKRLGNKLMKRHLAQFNPFVNFKSDETRFNPDSTYFCHLIDSQSIPQIIQNKRLLSRLQHVDTYLNLVLDQKAGDFCRKAKVTSRQSDETSM